MSDQTGERRSVKKLDGSSSVGKRVNARAEATAAVRKQLVRAKRHRHDGEASAEGVPTLNITEVAALVARCKANTASSEATAALREVRKALAHEDEQVIQHVLDAGVMEVLLVALQGACVDAQLEAAWCVTNIAAGNSAQTEAAMAAAPYMMQLLRSPSAAVQEQCAWAIGNMAGDNPEFRDRIRANGAALPTVDLLHRTSGNLATTAAWALSNMARGPDAKLHQLLAVGAGEKASVLLRESHARMAATSEGLSAAQASSGELSLLIEVAWLLSYLTYNQDEFHSFLLSTGVVTALVGLMHLPAQELQIPILRTIGNLVCGADEIVDGLLAEPGALERLYALMQAQHKGLVKEACWTLSNIAAGSPVHRQALVQCNFAPALQHVVENAHFDIRKEAAFALSHLVLDPQTRPHVLTPELGLEFVGLVRAPDFVVVDMALTVVEMVLAEVPGGVRLVEEADGIDALEQLVYAQAPAALVARASALVDKYYGEDAEPC